MAKCMQCGGAKKTPKALPKKMAKGGSTTNKLNNAKGFAPAQKGGDNTEKMIYGVPNAGMTGPNRNSQTETMQKGGALKKVDSAKNPGLAKLPTEVRNKMGYQKTGGATPKAKFGASVKVQRSPKAGKIRSASAQGYASIGQREPARIIKKTISKKK